MLHNPSSSPRPSSHTLHPGKAPKSLQASPKSKTGGKPRQTGISWEMVHFWSQWWDQGVWDPTLLFVPGSVTLSLTETHLPRMVLGNCFRLSECFRLSRVSRERGQTVLTGSLGRKASLILARQIYCICKRNLFFQEKCSGFSSLSAEHGW